MGAFATGNLSVPRFANPGTPYQLIRQSFIIKPLSSKQSLSSLFRLEIPLPGVKALLSSNQDHSPCVRVLLSSDQDLSFSAKILSTSDLTFGLIIGHSKINPPDSKALSLFQTKKLTRLVLRLDQLSTQANLFGSRTILSFVKKDTRCQKL